MSQMILRPPTIAEIRGTSVNLDYQLGQIIVYSRLLCDLEIIPRVYLRKSVFPERAINKNICGFSKLLGVFLHQFEKHEDALMVLNSIWNMSDVSRDSFCVLLNDLPRVNVLRDWCRSHGSEYEWVLERCDELLGGCKRYSVLRACAKYVNRLISHYNQVCENAQENPLKGSLFIGGVKDLLRVKTGLNVLSSGFFEKFLNGWCKDEELNTMTFLRGAVMNHVFCLEGQKLDLGLYDIFSVFPKEVCERFSEKYKIDFPSSFRSFDEFYRVFYSPEMITNILSECGINSKRGGVSRVNYELTLARGKHIRAKNKIKSLELVLQGKSVLNRGRKMQSLEKAREVFNETLERIKILSKSSTVNADSKLDLSYYLSFCVNHTSSRVCSGIIRMVKDGMSQVSDSNKYSYDFIAGISESSSRFIISFPRDSKLYACMARKGKAFLEQMLEFVQKQVYNRYKVRVTFSKILPLESY